MACDRTGRLTRGEQVGPTQVARPQWAGHSLLGRQDYGAGRFRLPDLVVQSHAFPSTDEVIHRDDRARTGNLQPTPYLGRGEAVGDGDHATPGAHDAQVGCHALHVHRHVDAYGVTPLESQRGQAAGHLSHPGLQLAVAGHSDVT